MLFGREISVKEKENEYGKGFFKKLSIDKCKNNPDKALFFVRETVENNWSRAVLLNFLDTDLYERKGKAISNFSKALPDAQSDLALNLLKTNYI